MEGETFLSPQGIYTVAGRLSLALCMCECQTGGHWGGDLRIGEKLLAKAVLEVPLAQFSFCSKRVETQWGEMVCRMQIDCGISGSYNSHLWGGRHLCVFVYASIFVVVS